MPDYLLKCMVIAALFTALGCQAAESPEETLRPVRIVTVSDEARVMTRVFPGTIRPGHEVSLSFKVSNTIKNIPVNKGQFVRTGDTIASLDSRDFEISIRQISGNLNEAKANLKAMLAGARPEDIQALESKLSAAQAALDEATLQYSRFQELRSTGAVAAADLDSARSSFYEALGQVNSLEMELEKAMTGARQEDIKAMQARISSLEARLDEARSALDDSILRAPFDGYVSEKYVDNHQNVTSGQPIVRLQNISRLEITVGIPEQLMIQKDMIKSIHIRLESFPKHFFPARIKELTIDASAMAMTYLLTAIMDRPTDIPVYPSMAADVYIAFGTKTQAGYAVVPETAIIFREGSSMVWVYDPNTGAVESRQVGAGELTHEGIRILHGLEPGEIIVSAGADFLEQGQRVRAVSEKMEP